MITSMTGYGRGEARHGKMAVAIEVKTVNHRHFEAIIKLPGGLWELESEMKKRLRDVIRRGRAEVYVHLLSPVAGTREPVVDVDLAAKYMRALSRAGVRLNLKGRPDLPLLARLPDVVRVEERPVQTNVVSPLVEKALQQALKRLAIMRRVEGKRLTQDIRLRLGLIRKTLQQIQQRFRVALKLQEQRLYKKISSWINTDGNEARKITQEVIIKHVRSDVTEEIVRLGSHLAQFGSFIQSKEPVGRRLDFLIQEMNREINTIGAKVNDAILAQHVVSVKEEIEKIREQVQNLE
ncbi:YicC family protein [bacterium]|nr:YicC family protein [bacterium]